MDDVYAHTPTRLSVLRYLQRLMLTVACGGRLRKDWWMWSSSESRGAGVNTAPRVPHLVRMSHSPLIHESDRVVDGLVRVAMCLQILVRRPAVTEDRSAGFDPVTNNRHQRVSRSVLNRNGEEVTGLTFDSAKHPLSFNSLTTR